MNRRGFLKSLVGAGMVAYASVALPWMPTLPPLINKRYAAIAYLQNRYNAFAKGSSSNYAPKLFEVSQELFEAYESELQSVQRFTSIEDLREGYRSLVFKAARVRVDPTLKGLEIRIS